MEVFNPRLLVCYTNLWVLELTKNSNNKFNVFKPLGIAGVYTSSQMTWLSAGSMISIEVLPLESAPWGWEQIWWELRLFNVYISQESESPLPVYTQKLQYTHTEDQHRRPTQTTNTVTNRPDNPKAISPSQQLPLAVYGRTFLLVLTCWGGGRQVKHITELDSHLSYFGSSSKNAAHKHSPNLTQIQCVFCRCGRGCGLTN